MNIKDGWTDSIPQRDAILSLLWILFLQARLAYVRRIQPVISIIAGGCAGLEPGAKDKAIIGKGLFPSNWEGITDESICKTIIKEVETKHKQN